MEQAVLIQFVHHFYPALDLGIANRQSLHFCVIQHRLVHIFALPFHYMAREDLADDGAKLPDWLGGASLAQAGYDIVSTSANMLPSIFVPAVYALIKSFIN